MTPQVGDWLLPNGDTSRAGLIIGMPNADGSPPYVIRWLRSGHIAMVSPGPHAGILSAAARRAIITGRSAS
jgi:Domain of unknown function (DUF1918)